MTPPKARLSKDGEWAVCSTDHCGTRLARIWWSVETIVTDVLNATDRADYRRRRARTPIDFLDFGAGWYRNRDGVWRMDGRAWKNLSRGKGPKMRQAPNPDTGLRFDAAGNVTTTRGRDRAYRPDSHLNKTSADEFPMEIVCPACGRRQLAERDGIALS